MSLAKLRFYDPYPKQKEFHQAGDGFTFRLFMAGNQLGKTDCGAAEFSFHTTGLYPPWWEGRRFDHPIVAWCGGDTNLTTRDIIQAKLFGEDGSPGTGFIPAECIGVSTPSRNISGGIDKIQIKHASGGWSTVVFKSYQQGRRKWQGKGVHLVWLDEEPENEIWGEAVARITATDGIIMLTFTPLEGLSEVVREFYPYPKSPEKYIIRMEMEEAQHEDGRSHLTEEVRKKLLSRYPAHQRDARLKGLPILGSGLVYPVEDNLIIEPPVELGRHWRHIIGLDPGGGESPTAWAWLAHDTEVDVVHLIHVYSAIDPRISVHASTIMAQAPKVFVAWPHDLRTQSRAGDGETYKALYQKYGVRMLEKSARFDAAAGGGANVEPGIAMILNRMLEGRFKASQMLRHFWEEFRTYHRVDGKIAKKDDHVLDAIRYAMMMLRFARPIEQTNFPTRTGNQYDPLKPNLGYQQDRGLPTRVH